MHLEKLEIVQKIVETSELIQKLVMKTVKSSPEEEGIGITRKLTMKKLSKLNVIKQQNSPPTQLDHTESLGKYHSGGMCMDSLDKDLEEFERELEISSGRSKSPPLDNSSIGLIQGKPIEPKDKTVEERIDSHASSKSAKSARSKKSSRSSKSRKSSKSPKTRKSSKSKSRTEKKTLFESEDEAYSGSPKAQENYEEHKSLEEPPNTDLNLHLTKFNVDNNNDNDAEKKTNEKSQFSKNEYTPQNNELDFGDENYDKENPPAIATMKELLLLKKFIKNKCFNLNLNLLKIALNKEEEKLAWYLNIFTFI